MLQMDKRKWVYLLCIVSLLLSTLACRVEAPRIILEEAPTVQPTIMITQVVTQIITATMVPTTPIPPPSPTLEPSPTPTFDPLSVPIYYPLADCVASRLHVGDRAMVSLVGGPNGIRYGPDVHEDMIDSYAQPGDILLIVGGPICSWGWIVWLVETENGVRGYTPEGDGNTYWLLPVE